LSEHESELFVNNREKVDRKWNFNRDDVPSRFMLFLLNCVISAISTHLVHSLASVVLVSVHSVPGCAFWISDLNSWKLEIGNWKLEMGNWKLEVGRISEDSLDWPTIGWQFYMFFQIITRLFETNTFKA
jgi:hypothetical protein